jgi:hypothetical protein
VALTSWSDDLLSSAEKYARSAMRALLDGDQGVFLLHAGTSFEHLSKGCLASLHNSLIAAPDFDSLLHACGVGRHAKKPLGQMRTITFGDAVVRAQQLVPELGNAEASLRLLLQARNGVAHAALIDVDAIEATTDAWLRACQALLDYAGRDTDDFWGELLPVVQVRLTKSAQEASRRATDKITSARLVFEGKVDALDRDVRAALVLAIEGSYVVEPYEQQLRVCPACGTLSLITGTVDVDWEPDWDFADGESYIAGAYPAVTFYPSSLECRACGLALSGDGELVAAGVERSWKLDDVDPDDFRPEPDWDDIGD